MPHGILSLFLFLRAISELSDNWFNQRLIEGILRIPCADSALLLREKAENVERSRLRWMLPRKIGTRARDLARSR